MATHTKSGRKTSKQAAPWERPAPKKGPKKTLTDEQIQEAKSRAAKAGRPYPNLVDNMAVARKARKAT